jgi:proteic killer suppression protein
MALQFVKKQGRSMIKTFANKETENLFSLGKSRICPTDVAARAIRKLDMIDNAFVLSDLRVPPGNRLHALQGDRAGQYSISVNDKWRICFRFDAGHAYDVEFCDYH